MIINYTVDTPISGLNAGSALGGAEIFPAVQATSTVRLTIGQIKDFFDLFYARLAWNNIFSKGQTVTPVALTDAASVSTNATLSNSFSLALTTSVGPTRVLANPTGLADGQVINYLFTQPAVGGCSLTLGSMFKTPGGAALTLTTTANAVDGITAKYWAAKNILVWVPLTNIS